jgi:hypothetical protein
MTTHGSIPVRSFINPDRHTHEELLPIKPSPIDFIYGDSFLGIKTKEAGS